MFCFANCVRFLVTLIPAGLAGSGAASTLMVGNVCGDVAAGAMAETAEAASKNPANKCAFHTSENYSHCRYAGSHDNATNCRSARTSGVVGAFVDRALAEFALQGAAMHAQPARGFRNVA